MSPHRIALMAVGDAAHEAARWLIRHVDPLLARRAEEGRPSANVRWVRSDDDALSSTGAALLAEGQRIIVPIVIQRFDLGAFEALGRLIANSPLAQPDRVALAARLRYVAFSCPWLADNPNNGTSLFATLSERVRESILGQPGSRSGMVWNDPLCLGVVRADQRLWGLSDDLSRPTYELGRTDGIDKGDVDALHVAFGEASDLVDGLSVWLGPHSVPGPEAGEPRIEWRRKWVEGPTSAGKATLDGAPQRGQALDDWQQHRSRRPQLFVCLGEPGAGKSDEMTRLERRRSSATRIDLASSLRPERDVETTAEGLSDSDGTLILDGLDALDDSTAGAVLGVVADYLSGSPDLDRRAFVAARPSRWRSWWDEALENRTSFVKLHIEPLDEYDIKRLAAAYDADGVHFTREVRAGNLTALAGVPLLTHMLLRRFLEDGSLRTDRTDLFSRAVVELAREPNLRVRERSGGELPPPDDRLALAGEVAWQMQMRRLNWVDCSDSTSDAGLGRTDIVAYSTLPNAVRALDDLRQSALFTQVGPERFAFAHASFGEFLAARHAANRPNLNGVLDLLTAGSGGSGVLIDPTLGVAAWLAALNFAAARRLAETDPLALLEGRVEIPETERGHLVEQLRLGHEHRLLSLASFWRYDASTLDHEGLPAQTLAWLDHADVTVRQAGTYLARAHPNAETNRRLADMALDSSQPVELRSLCVQALERPDSADTVGHLLEHFGGDCSDPAPLPVWASLLQVGWSLGLLSVRDVIERLPTDVDSAAEDDWIVLFYRLAATVEGLDADALPSAIKWAGRQLQAAGGHRHHLATAILRKACTMADVRPDVAQRLAEALRPALCDPYATWPRLGPLNEPQQQAVLSYLVPLISDEEHVVDLGERESLLGGVSPEWLEEQSRSAAPAVAGNWSRLASDARWRATRPVRSRRPASRVADEEDSTDADWGGLLSKAIQAPDSADSRRTWRAADRALCALDGSHFRSTHVGEPSWSRLATSEKDRLIALAGAFVAAEPPDAENWFGTNRFTSGLMAAYRAWRLLHSEGRIDAIEPQVMVAWTPLFLHVIGDWGEAHLEVLRRMFRADPDSWLTWWRRWLDSAQTSDPVPQEPFNAASGCWNNRVASELRERLIASETPVAMCNAVLDFLLRQEDARALQWARDHLDRTGIAATLLRRRPDTWVHVLDYLEDHPGQTRSLLDPYLARHFGGPSVPPIDALRLADLYVLLRQHYPEPDLGTIISGAPSGASTLRRNLLDSILDGGADAVAALSRIVDAGILRADELNHWANLTLQARRREAAKRHSLPSVSELRRLRDEEATRYVESPARLLAVVCDTLDAVEEHLQGSNSPLSAVRGARGECQNEDDLSDFVRSELVHKLGSGPKQTIVNREAQIGPVKARPDFLVQAVSQADQDTITVVVEAKGDWSRERHSAIEEQLCNDYLSLYGDHAAGLFLVYRTRLDDEATAALQHRLDQKAASLCSRGRTVRAYILDLRCPELRSTRR